MSVHYTCTWCPQRLEDVSPPGAGAAHSCEMLYNLGAGSQAQVLCQGIQGSKPLSRLFSFVYQFLKVLVYPQNQFSPLRACRAFGGFGFLSDLSIREPKAAEGWQLSVRYRMREVAMPWNGTPGRVGDTHVLAHMLTQPPLPLSFSTFF